MKKYKLLAVTIFVALAQNAFASVDSAEVIADPAMETMSPQQVAQAATPIMRDGIFKAVGNQVDADGSKFVDFVPAYIIENGKVYQNFDALTLSDQEAVAVKFRDDGLVELTMQLDDSEEGNTPNVAILTQEQFSKLSLAFDKEGDAEILARDYSRYDDADYARRGHRELRVRRRNHYRHAGAYRMHYRAPNGHAYGGCVAYVASRIGFSGTAGNGTGMASALVATGRWEWDYSGPSVGDICSYSGGPRGQGDACIVEMGQRGLCCRYDLGCHGMTMRGYHLKHCVRQGGGGWGRSEAPRVRRHYRRRRR